MFVYRSKSGFMEATTKETGNDPRLLHRTVPALFLASNKAKQTGPWPPLFSLTLPASFGPARLPAQHRLVKLCASFED